MSVREALRRILSAPAPAPAPPPNTSASQPLAPATRATDEESLGRELLRLDWGLGLFRWVHLVEAVERASPASRVVSFGSGEGLHEALLARTRPDLSVLGVDLRASQLVDLPPNVRFLSGDLLDPSFRATLPQADLVFSIECLEHIEDDTTVASAMAERLLPGGYFYVQVPFASPAEQRDPVLCENERRCFGHVRPGYDAETLRALAGRLGLEVAFIAGAFWSPLQPVIWAAVEKFGPALSPSWRAILDLVRQDVRPGLPNHRGEAVAIKMLAKKPG